MNFRQLKAFNAVMQTGSITGAAKQMLVSQPSVTRLIRDLELNLGFALFVRQGRGIIATVEARRFHLAVESTFLNIERLDDLAASIRKKAVGKISIGVIPTFSTSLLPQVLGQMRGRMTRPIRSYTRTIHRPLSTRSGCSNLTLALSRDRRLMLVWISFTRPW